MAGGSLSTTIDTIRSGVIDINLDYSSIIKASGFLQQAPDKIQKAISPAINRALEHFKTIELRETAKKYYVKQKDFKGSIFLKWSSGGLMDATLVARGHRQPITKFAVSPKKNPVKQGSFRGAVKRAGGLKPIPPAFLAPFRGDVRAFINDGGRWRMLMSPSVPQMMKNKETVAEAEKSSREVFVRRLEHELKRVGALP